MPVPTRERQGVQCKHAPPYHNNYRVTMCLIKLYVTHYVLQQEVYCCTLPVHGGQRLSCYYTRTEITNACSVLIYIPGVKHLKLTDYPTKRKIWYPPPPTPRAFYADGLTHYRLPNPGSINTSPAHATHRHTELYLVPLCSGMQRPLGYKFEYPKDLRVVHTEQSEW